MYSTHICIWYRYVNIYIYIYICAFVYNFSTTNNNNIRIFVLLFSSRKNLQNYNFSLQSFTVNITTQFTQFNTKYKSEKFTISIYPNKSIIIKNDYYSNNFFFFFFFFYISYYELLSYNFIKWIQEALLYWIRFIDLYWRRSVRV